MNNPLATHLSRLYAFSPPAYADPWAKKAIKAMKILSLWHLLSFRHLVLKSYNRPKQLCIYVRFRLKYKQKVKIIVTHTYVAKKKDILGFNLLRNAP